ncbi:MAG TPA: RT0821/Lpp0805 family surface protein [Burkholderiaceae bacterium]|nr:RT0821/Lpp0805 family surface protein [Burkholderiaceae bacterium]
MTYHKRICCISAALITALFSSQTFAANALFAARGPLGNLKKDDVEIARAAIRTALDSGPDGQAQTWSNPKTKASGTVKPTKTFSKDGMRCRTADFSTSAGGERGASTWNLCKTKEGWKVVQ